MKFAGTFTCVGDREVELLVMQIESLLYLCDIVVVQANNPSQKVLEILNAYKREGRFYFITNQQEDEFWVHDEYGDRDRLLALCKQARVDMCFHTDADEIVSPACLSDLKELMQSLDQQVILKFRRYDLWGNAHNYRLPTSLAQVSRGKEEIDFPTHVTYEYIFPVTPDANYGSVKQMIPNYHCFRLPAYSVQIPSILIEDIKIIHYGYLTPQKIQEKNNFYLINNKVTGNVMGQDMKLTTEAYKNLYGVGFLDRGKTSHVCAKLKQQSTQEIKPPIQEIKSEIRKPGETSDTNQ
jgi:hypothetical protein